MIPARPQPETGIVPAASFNKGINHLCSLTELAARAMGHCTETEIIDPQLVHDQAQSLLWVKLWQV